MQPSGPPPLIAAMLNPLWYDHTVASCSLIETHISWVILAGDYAYKVKKPVDLGFLDFSTLDKRRFYCEEEIRLNQRLAPMIYLEVVPISGSVGGPVLKGAGEVIEYAVKMVQFPQEAQLDRMLDAGRLMPRHMDAFARLIADFHQRTLVADNENPYGEPEHIWQPVAENFSQIRDRIHRDAPLAALAGLEQWSSSSFADLLPLLKQRKREGFIRECHGDMHLRNLAWVDEAPIAFDGIEFNAGLRWIDTMSEVAFLVMDLQGRGDSGLAQRFINSYLERCGDYAGLGLMPFYLVYRALVRAKVAAIRLVQPDMEDNVREAVELEFDHYLALAEAYTGCRTPLLILTRGLSGSGKTTLTLPLVELLPAIRIRSDVERKRLFGLEAEEDGGAAPAEGIYSAEATEKTYRHLLKLAEAMLGAGYSVIVDATFLKRSQREPFRRIAQLKSVPMVILDLAAPSEVLRQRLRQRKGDASDADLAVLEHQLADFGPLDEDEKADSIAVNTEGKVDAGGLVARIRSHLEGGLNRRQSHTSGRSDAERGD